MKIVVNKCFGGFGLSNKAVKRYLELGGKQAYFYEQDGFNYALGKPIYILTNEENDESFVSCSTKYLGEKVEDIPDKDYFYYDDINRTDKKLIQVIEELGSEANAKFAELEIIEIPDDVEWEISDYDGVETIHEKHRSW